MKIFSAAQLHEADKATTEKHEITFIDLMENAGAHIFNWLHQRMQGAQVPIHIFCGIGNNGGDGLVVGRKLIEAGYNVEIYVANFTDKRSKCFLINYDRVKEITKKWPKLMTSVEDFPEISPEDIVIDAIFGIGLNRPPEGWVKELIQYLNKQKAFKLSIDIPSGMYPDQALGDAEAVLKANHTLTFQSPKLAFFLPETGIFVPYYEVLDIGLDPEYLQKTAPLAELISQQEAQQFYKQREKFSHKGSYGHALLVAGSYGKIGAAVLCTKAALRMGAGLVTAFVPECGYHVLQTYIPEALVITDKEDDLITNISCDFEPTVIGVGPGIGTKKETVAALKKLFSEAKVPLVIDADALNCIASTKDLLKVLPKNSILTPHPGELKALIGEWTDDFDKLEKTKKFSEEKEVIVLIKGAHSITVVGKKLYINNTGNPGMATAGSGDVLTGMITGLVAQGYDALLATLLGAYLHGRAGNLVAETKGFEALIATDIIDFIGDAYLDLFKQPEVPEQQEK
jgi:hydroxyethylthiazole kinase-like uncharacterized protein yjeF